MSQHTLAEMTNTWESFLSRLERGRVRVMTSCELLVKLCQVLDLDYNELMKVDAEDQIRLGEVVN